MSIPSRHGVVRPSEDGDGDFDQRFEAPTEPTLEGAFSDDGVDLTLIHWMLRQSPTGRLRAAQDLIDAAWALRNKNET